MRAPMNKMGGIGGKAQNKNKYYSVPQLFVLLLFFCWIKGCVKFQRTTQVYFNS